MGQAGNVAKDLDIGLDADPDDARLLEMTQAGEPEAQQNRNDKRAGGDQGGVDQRKKERLEEAEHGMWHDEHATA
jgi:hypothetical protein